MNINEDSASCHSNISSFWVFRICYSRSNCYLWGAGPANFGYFTCTYTYTGTMHSQILSYPAAKTYVQVCTCICTHENACLSETVFASWLSNHMRGRVYVPVFFFFFFSALCDLQRNHSSEILGYKIVKGKIMMNDKKCWQHSVMEWKQIQYQVQNKSEVLALYLSPFLECHFLLISRPQIQREIMYFVLHCICLTAVITNY